MVPSIGTNITKRYAQKKALITRKPLLPHARGPPYRVWLQWLAHVEWKVHQLYIKTAFLNGDLLTKMYNNATTRAQSL